jgi:glycolate oxidase
MTADALLARLESIVGRERVVSGEALAPFERDESDVGARSCDAAVEVASADEVEALVALARESGVPLVARGTGTGKVGGALAERRGVVVSFAKMDAIREIDPVDLVAVVEPGVVTGRLQAEVESRGLFYPPDPSSLETCTIGGNVAHNAGGPRALKYGVTRDWVLGLEAVLGTGARVRTGRRSIKGVTGYDLTALLVGSEGTLGLVTQITLQLAPKPVCAEAVVAAFTGTEGESNALRAVNGLFAAGVTPRACEFLDAEASRAVRTRSPVPIASDVTGVLLVEVDGSPEACGADLETIERVCLAAGAGELVGAQGEIQRARLWEMRRLVSPSLRSLRPLKMSEDVAVPRGRMLDLVREVRAIGLRFGLGTAVYGHAGDGNLHVNLLFDSREDAVRVSGANEAVLAAAVKLGGTLSGEHGIGLAKRPFLGIEQSAGLIDAQRAVKRALDPLGILNPGKIFPS